MNIKEEIKQIEEFEQSIKEQIIKSRTDIIFLHSEITYLTEEINNTNIQEDVSDKNALFIISINRKIEKRKRELRLEIVHLKNLEEIRRLL